MSESKLLNYFNLTLINSLNTAFVDFVNLHWTKVSEMGVTFCWMIFP